MGHKWRYGNAKNPDLNPYRVRECKRCGYFEDWTFSAFKASGTGWGREYGDQRDREMFQWSAEKHVSGTEF